MHLIRLLLLGGNLYWACEYEYSWRSVDYECECECPEMLRICIRADPYILWPSTGMQEERDVMSGSSYVTE
jgi:hypothetical protein